MRIVEFKSKRDDKLKCFIASIQVVFVMLPKGKLKIKNFCRIGFSVYPVIFRNESDGNSAYMACMYYV